jgi:hypothetical protein
MLARLRNLLQLVKISVHQMIAITIVSLNQTAISVTYPLDFFVPSGYVETTCTSDSNPSNINPDFLSFGNYSFNNVSSLEPVMHFISRKIFVDYDAKGVGLSSEP